MIYSIILQANENELSLAFIDITKSEIQNVRDALECEVNINKNWSWLL